MVIDEEEGGVTLTPEKDWCGKETLTFIASDGSSSTKAEVLVTVRPVNDPPGPVEITTPKNDDMVDDGEAIELEGECNDPDLPYGDELTFVWTYGDEDEELGRGQKLDDVYLPIGEHLIVLRVTDSEGESNIGYINITVLETPASDSDGDGIPNEWEREHGLDPDDPLDADADPDGDGIPNSVEYKEGTDPLVEDNPEPEDGGDIPDGTDGDDINETTDGGDGAAGGDGKGAQSGDGNLLPVLIVIVVIAIIAVITLIMFMQNKKKGARTPGGQHGWAPTPAWTGANAPYTPIRGPAVRDERGLGTNMKDIHPGSDPSPQPSPLPQVQPQASDFVEKRRPRMVPLEDPGRASRSGPSDSSDIPDANLSGVNWSLNHNKDS